MFSALGIDIGKSTLALCTPVPGQQPRHWPVTTLSYKEQPDWWRILIAMLNPGAVVCFEPTGYHLAAPIMAVLDQMTDAEIWLVGHGTSGRVRELQVARAKTDEMDARAIAVVAQWVSAGMPPPGTRRYNVQLEQQVMGLRTLVNNYARVTKTKTRLTNRLHAFAHALFPQIDIKFETWLALAKQGFITPCDIHAYVDSLPEERDRRTTRQIELLAAALPPIEPPIYAARTIADTLPQLIAAEDEAAYLEGQITGIVTAPPFDEVTRRVLTMPGISRPMSIAPYLVATHGLLGEMSPDEVKSAIGISAKTNTSGGIDKTRAMKGGYKPAMTALYMWAQYLLTPTAPDNPLKPYQARLKERGKRNAFRATRAKLATLLAAVAADPNGYRA
jgi:hypothetical protein